MQWKLYWSELYTQTAYKRVRLLDKLNIFIINLRIKELRIKYYNKDNMQEWGL